MKSVFPKCVAFELCRSLVILATLASAACRRHSPGVNAATAPAAVPAGAATRAAGEFVRTPRRTILGADEVRVPIELVTYMPVVAFTSGEGVRRRMILDTGADSVLVTPGFAAAGRLTTRPSDRTYRDASGTGAGTSIATIATLELGAARFEDFDADVAALYAGSDALLGWPLWRDVLVTIDYRQRMLVLKRGELSEPDGKRILPLRLDHDRLMVPATLDGREIWLNLDTGWGVGDSVELTTARAAEVAWASPAVSTMATNAPDGVVAQKLGRLKGDLIVGRYRFVRPIAGVNGGVAADILGAVALSNFAVTLDLKKMRVRFDRATDEPIAPGPVWVAGFDCDLKSRPLKVIGVLPGSEAARAGLRAGDLLLTIDGRPAFEGLFSHADGPFAIELRSGERTFSLTVPMTKLVP